MRAAASEPVEGPWALPKEWRWERLDNVAAINPTRKLNGLDDDDEVAFVGMAAVEAETGGIDVSKRRLARQVRQGFTRFASGDLLFAKITPCMENGKIAIVPDIPHGIGVGSTEFHVLAPEAIVPRYLYHWVSQRSFRETAEFSMTGTAGQKRVPPGFLRNAAIALPPTGVQHRIVDRIDGLFAEIDDGDATLARARDDLATWRKALLKAAVTGELTADWRAESRLTETGADLLDRILAERRSHWHADRRNKGKRYVEPMAPERTNLPGLPSGWVWATVGQLAIIDSGGTPPGIEAASKPTGEIPWFKVSSMALPGNERQLRMSKWWLSREQATKAGLRIFPAGSLVFPKLGGALLTNKRRLLATDGCLDLNNMAVTPMAIVADYIWLLFTGIDLADLSDGSVVPQLKRQAVENIPVALPPPNELAETVARVGAAFDEADSLNGNASDLEVASATLRQSILAATFRGELAA